jgi:ABC-2 type transport system ATP-binding protein
MAISLKIDNVSKSFKSNVVLKGLSLSAKSGDIIGLIGKSGCGKSTLLKVLVGYHKPDSGEILLDGNDISREKMHLRKLVGYVTQENSFYEKLSVIENMRYYANLYDVPFFKRRDRITALLEKVGLYEHRKTLAGNISGGMKRRLDFAIALVHNPSILILDEPTAGLDPLLIEQFWQIVHEVVAEEQKIVLMSSHILSEIEKYCSKAAVMHKGTIVKVLQKSEMKNLEDKFRKLVRG